MRPTARSRSRRTTASCLAYLFASVFDVGAEERGSGRERAYWTGAGADAGAAVVTATAFAADNIVHEAHALQAEEDRFRAPKDAAPGEEGHNEDHESNEEENSDKLEGGFGLGADTRNVRPMAEDSRMTETERHGETERKVTDERLNLASPGGSLRWSPKMTAQSQQWAPSPTMSIKQLKTQTQTESSVTREPEFAKGGLQPATAVDAGLESSTIIALIAVVFLSFLAQEHQAHKSPRTPDPSDGEGGVPRTA
ncbi:hypothetical protein GALMADRAFT_148511 [Galerina marginata CBS 339.88]|uniref:Uncharacterized protein n=1 Tax=Galerina marginata (strain CBS 339.88) TaxID=685588 RepID=A0A067SD24_GALM3|nr:hypothetical protein GALMADRAFT_148511 [Galerina marginata CBS 339.88]